ncbi:MAG: hypothetical protein AAGD05_11750 [Bacteroidota bacterium]
MLKKLKSLFIEEDGEPTKPAQKPAKTQKEPADSIPTNRPSESDNHQLKKGEVTEKFRNILLGVLEKNNIEGFDYLEFKQSLRSLAKMPMDEATRFKSAFAMAQTMGTTPQKLIETAQFYLDVLQKEEKKFGSALVNQRSKQIGNKEQTIQQLAKVIEQKAAQIKQLTQEIDQHQKQMEQMRQEIGAATIKVENTKVDFDATYTYIVNQIQQDVANIKKYLAV